MMLRLIYSHTKTNEIINEIIDLPVELTLIEDKLRVKRLGLLQHILHSLRSFISKERYDLSGTFGHVDLNKYGLFL